ncbi:hypothetical protein KJZ71_03955 [Patescibacteria group bacterium]|nr:hypothetical protein [Patescibacteria group bacterium]
MAKLPFTSQGIQNNIDFVYVTNDSLPQFQWKQICQFLRTLKHWLHLISQDAPPLDQRAAD